MAQKQYDFGRFGEIAKAVDKIENKAEAQINALYTDAFLSATRKKKKALRELRALLDGETKPPAWYVTDAQKERWREKKIKALLNSSKLDHSFLAYEMKAGDEAVQIIQRMSAEIYETAYNRTMEELRRL